MSRPSVGQSPRVKVHGATQLVYTKLKGLRFNREAVHHLAQTGTFEVRQSRWASSGSSWGLGGVSHGAPGENPGYNASLVDP